MIEMAWQNIEKLPYENEIYLLYKTASEVKVLSFQDAKKVHNDLIEKGFEHYATINIIEYVKAVEKVKLGIVE